MGNGFAWSPVEARKPRAFYILSQQVKVLDVFLEKNKKYLADGGHRPHIGFRAINSDQEAIADIVNVAEFARICPVPR
jgi:hypothetical protein